MNRKPILPASLLPKAITDARKLNEAESDYARKSAEDAAKQRISFVDDRRKRLS